MKKNIALGLSIFVSIFFILYVNIKANEAEKYAIQAELSLKLAMENEAKAKEQEKLAVSKVRLAEMKAAELQEKLNNCR